jgi:hypothetical protein
MEKIHNGTTGLFSKKSRRPLVVRARVSRRAELGAAEEKCAGSGGGDERGRKKDGVFVDKVRDAPVNGEDAGQVTVD